MPIGTARLKTSPPSNKSSAIERQRTGKGCYLEISLFVTALHFLNYTAQAYWQTGNVPRKMGSADGAIAPYQAFRTSDGHIMLGAAWCPCQSPS
jgi:formyl-CoA transferase